jgi:hypothetical protein
MSQRSYVLGHRQRGDYLAASTGKHTVTAHLPATPTSRSRRLTGQLRSRRLIAQGRGFGSGHRVSRQYPFRRVPRGLKVR